MQDSHPICPRCGSHVREEQAHIRCPQCGIIDGRWVLPDEKKQIEILSQIILAQLQSYAVPRSVFDQWRTLTTTVLMFQPATAYKVIADIPTSAVATERSGSFSPLPNLSKTDLKEGYDREGSTVQKMLRQKMMTWAHTHPKYQELRQKLKNQLRRRRKRRSRGGDISGGMEKIIEGRVPINRQEFRELNFRKK